MERHKSYYEYERFQYRPARNIFTTICFALSAVGAYFVYLEMTK